MNRNLLGGQLASESPRRRELEAVAVLRAVDALRGNEVLSLLVGVVQPQVFDSRELEDDYGLPLPGEVSRAVHRRAQVPRMNSNQGQPTAIDDDGEHFGVLKRGPVAEPRDDGVCAGDFGHHYSHAELAR
jgi:hypothetical protein